MCNLDKNETVRMSNIKVNYSSACEKRMNMTFIHNWSLVVSVAK